jgi:hypothetical protein
MKVLKLLLLFFLFCSEAFSQTIPPIVKGSELDVATTPTGSEYIIGIQGGHTKRFPWAYFSSGGGGTITSVFGRSTAAITAQPGDYAGIYYPFSSNPNHYISNVTQPMFRRLISATAPILYDSTTASFTLQYATSSQPGGITAANFTNFSAKQDPLFFRGGLQKIGNVVSGKVVSNSDSGVVSPAQKVYWDQKQNPINITNGYIPGRVSAGSGPLEQVSLGPDFTVLGGSLKYLGSTGTNFSIQPPLAWYNGGVAPLTDSASVNVVDSAGVQLVDVGSGTVLGVDTANSSRDGGFSSNDYRLLHSIQPGITGLVGDGHTIGASGTANFVLENINPNVGTWNNVQTNAKGQVIGGSNIPYLTNITNVISNTGNGIAISGTGTTFDPYIFNNTLTAAGNAGEVQYKNSGFGFAAHNLFYYNQAGVLQMRSPANNSSTGYNLAASTGAVGAAITYYDLSSSSNANSLGIGTRQSGGKILFQQGISSTEIGRFDSDKSFKVGDGTTYSLTVNPPSSGGTVNMKYLGGGGTQMVVTDNLGNLSAQAIPSGSGSSLTINNNVDNRILTANGLTTSIDGESNLNWNGSTLGVGISNPSSNVISQFNKNINSPAEVFVSNDNTSNSAIASLKVGLNSTDPSTNYAGLAILGSGTALGGVIPAKTALLEANAGSNLTVSNYTNNDIVFATNARVERFRITGAGALKTMLGNGSSTQMATIAPDGTIGAATIPSGGGGSSLAINNNVNFRVLTANGGTTSIDARSSMSINGSGIVNIPALGGGGTQMVITDNSGNLSMQAIPTGSSGGDLGVVNMNVVGSSPNGFGGSITGGTTLTLQPYDRFNPGVVTANPQTMFGDKTFGQNGTDATSTASQKSSFGLIFEGSAYTGSGATPNRFTIYNSVSTSSNGSSSLNILSSGSVITSFDQSGNFINFPSSSFSIKMAGNDRITAGTGSTIKIPSISGGGNRIMQVANDGTIGVLNGLSTQWVRADGQSVNFPLQFANAGSTPNPTGASINVSTATPTITLQVGDASNAGLVSTSDQVFSGNKILGQNGIDPSDAASQKNSWGLKLRAKLFNGSSAVNSDFVLYNSASTTSNNASEFKLLSPTGGDALRISSNATYMDFPNTAMVLSSGGITRMGFIGSGSSSVYFPSLQGTATRMVVTDASGILSTQAIPSGGTSIALGNVGSLPNNQAATLTSGILSIQPATQFFPGVVTVNDQKFSGNKYLAQNGTDASSAATQKNSWGLFFEGSSYNGSGAASNTFALYNSASTTTNGFSEFKLISSAAGDIVQVANNATYINLPSTNTKIKVAGLDRIAWGPTNTVAMPSLGGSGNGRFVRSDNSGILSTSGLISSDITTALGYTPANAASPFTINLASTTTGSSFGWSSSSVSGGGTATFNAPLAGPLVTNGGISNAAQVLKGTKTIADTIVFTQPYYMYSRYPANDNFQYNEQNFMIEMTANEAPGGEIQGAIDIPTNCSGVIEYIIETKVKGSSTVTAVDKGNLFYTRGTGSVTIVSQTHDSGYPAYSGSGLSGLVCTLFANPSSIDLVTYSNASSATRVTGHFRIMINKN